MSEEIKEQQKPALTKESVESQLQSATQQARESYDKYQKALGVMELCQHQLRTFDFPTEAKKEESKLGEIK